jgi:hypothetical protein
MPFPCTSGVREPLLRGGERECERDRERDIEMSRATRGEGERGFGDLDLPRSDIMEVRASQRSRIQA